MARIEILPGEWYEIMPKDYCEKCLVLEKALDHLVDLYLVADEYEGEERIEDARKIKDNLLKRMGE